MAWIRIGDEFLNLDKVAKISMTMVRDELVVQFWQETNKLVRTVSVPKEIAGEFVNMIEKATRALKVPSRP
jgi:acid phosphatase class B